MYRITLYEHGAYPNGGQVLLDTSSGTNLGIISSATEEQLNEAGSYTYGIVPSSPLYNMTDPLNYYVSVEENGEETFYGRILSVQKNPITAIKQVTCEGALAFLLDAEMPIDKDGTSYTAAQYFARCIQEFNSQIGNDPARAMSVGTIDITGSSESAVYKNGSYTQIQSVIKSQLVDKYDGFLHVRRTSGGQHVIDWVEQVGRTDPQPVRVTQNVIDQTTTDSGEDIFTLMRPVGKDSVSPGLMTVSQDMLNRYGRIIRTVSFPDEETAAGVAAKANAYITKLRDRLTLSGDISFIDFNYLDGTKPRVRIGDVFTNIVGYEGTKLTAGSLSRDHLAPQNDKLSLKNDKDLMSSAVASGANSATTAVGSGGGRSFSSGGSYRYKFIHETDKDLALAARNIELSAEEKIAINAREIETNAESIQQNSAAILAENEKWTEFEGTTFYQNKEHITAVAGRYTIDQYGNVYLADGASFSVSKNGVLTNVGTAIERQDQSIDNLQNWKTTYEGTAIYQNREHIAQVAGVYTLEEYIEDGQRKKRLIISDGTQLYQSRSSGRFALYDQGTLTAGVMFNKLSDGRTSTGLLGSKVYIGNASDQLDEWVEETDEGLVVIKARIKTLETDTLLTRQLYSAISALDLVSIKEASITTAGIQQASVTTLNASTINFTVNEGGHDVRTSIKNVFLSEVQIVSAGNNQFKLQYKHPSDSEWQDAGTFSRAVSLSGAWNGTTYRVSATNGTISGTAPSTTVYTQIEGTTNPGTTVYAKTYHDTPGDGTKLLNTVTATLGENTGSKYVELYTGSGANKLQKGKISTAATYNAGWAAARAKNTIPGASTGSSITPGWPPSTVDGAAETRTYTLANDGNDAVKLYYSSGGSNITAARYVHGKYTAGWNAAYGTVSLPSAGSSTTFTLKTPSSVVGNTITTVYGLSSLTDDIVVVKNSSGTEVGRITHGKYTAGKNGVYVSEWTGTDIGGSDESNSNPITAKLSNGGSYSKTIYMGIGSWGSGKCGVTTRLEDSNGIVINRVYVSAPGVTGLRAVKNGNQQIIYGKVGGSSERNLGTISIPS